MFRLSSEEKVTGVSPTFDPSDNVSNPKSFRKFRKRKVDSGTRDFQKRHTIPVDARASFWVKLKKRVCI